MANHTSSGASSDDGEGSKQDNQPEPQMDSVMHKDLLDAVLHDLKTQERIEDLQKKCSYTGPMLHLLTHGRFDNMGSPLPYKLRVLYEKEAKNFQVINRMMFTKDHGDGRIQLVVPVVMRAQLLSNYHDSVLSGHRGKSQMLNAISKNYFWRGMVKDTKYHVHNCKTHHYKPKFFNTRRHLDFLEKLKTYKDGYKHCFVAIDSASLFLTC